MRRELALSCRRHRPPRPRSGIAEVALACKVGEGLESEHNKLTQTPLTNSCTLHCVRMRVSRWARKKWKRYLNKEVVRRGSIDRGPRWEVATSGHPQIRNDVSNKVPPLIVAKHFCTATSAHEQHTHTEQGVGRKERINAERKEQETEEHRASHHGASPDGAYTPGNMTWTRCIAYISRSALNSERPT